jgi:hypothetical protein
VPGGMDPQRRSENAGDSAPMEESGVYRTADDSYISWDQVINVDDRLVSFPALTVTFCFYVDWLISLFLH